MLPYRDSKITKIALAVFFVIIAGYAYYEAQGILFGPSINISGRAMLVSDPYIEIKGQAVRISSLWMNGQEVSVTEDGSFDEPYVLSQGYNRITLDAKDKYGKTAERVIEIVYQPSATATPSTLKTTTPSAFVPGSASTTASSTAGMAH